jgi:glycine/D-amino acid oxidase-like deaminating enzyme
MRDIEVLTSTQWDIAIVGGGNAALCAAMTAAEAGARVLILEGAPKAYRGGNSRHTRNFRCMHQEPLRVLTESYEEKEYFDDLMRVTKARPMKTLPDWQSVPRKNACHGWKNTVCGSSLRFRELSASRAPMRFFSAVARPL